MCLLIVWKCHPTSSSDIPLMAGSTYLLILWKSQLSSVSRDNFTCGYRLLLIRSLSHVSAILKRFLACWECSCASSESVISLLLWVLVVLQRIGEVPSLCWIDTSCGLVHYTIADKENFILLQFWASTRCVAGWLFWY